MLTPCWPHAPTHQLSGSGTFIVTAATYNKEHHFRGAERLSVLQRGLLKLAAEHGWALEAWAIFSNHYHFVAHSPTAVGESLPQMLAILHKKTAIWVNRLEKESQRQIWHNYWKTRLTYQRSYLARLNYVHQNPVRHGLVQVANQYPFCSAGWFERNSSPASVKSIYRFAINTVSIRDDFDVNRDW